MKSSTVLLAVSFCTSLASAAASNSFSYPTLWVVQNNCLKATYVECEGQASGLSSKIPFHLLIESKKVFKWDGWYNDGLGLNPANWICAADYKEYPLRNNIKPMSYFSVKKFGQSINLSINCTDNSVVVNKAE